ncbi:MAG: Smr/MutS family protein [Bacilli bacterium]|nr:Smr/MutS family protein [Bacilli bacterium]
MISLYNNLPTLDLHGLDRDYARILINDFVKDNYIIKNKKVVIVHGNGSGIIKKTTQETLKKNKLVANYKIDNFNSGMTVVDLKEKVDK